MKDNDTFRVLDPKSTFVVYDSSLDKRVIAGVRYYEKSDANNIPTSYIEVYRDKSIYIDLQEVPVIRTTNLINFFKISEQCQILMMQC